MNTSSDDIVIGLLLFPRLTVLDLIGPYQVFTRLPGARVELIASSLDLVHDHEILALKPTCTFATAPKLDLLCVPGGPGDAEAYEDEATLNYVRKAGGEARWITSVCTGSMILGAAGLLRGKRATTHWSSLEMLREFGAEPVAERIVEDGNLITGGGVTAGIDFALAVAAKLRGELVAQAIQLTLEYAPAPPFDAGRPDTAPPEVLQVVEQAQARFIARRAERVKAAAKKL